MTKIIIVSLNGDDNSGGVERVVYYLRDVLSREYSVDILKKSGRSGKFDKLVYPFVFSFLLLFKKKSFIISNSWQSFLFPVDLSIHHGTTAGYIKQTNITSLKSRLLAWMEKVSAQRAKTVIAVSENCKRELIDLYGIEPAKIAVLNNFVDEHLFYPETEKQNDKITILFSGRLEERKGLSGLLELAHMIEANDKYRLKIAVNSEANREMFADLKNTHIESNLDINDMRGFYNSGDIFYFPTNYEGFSMATLEALACGIPVIGSAFAIPEELRHYEFAKIANSAELRNLPEQISGLVSQFKNRRQEIHKAIINDFGVEQYRQKLFALIGEKNGNA